MRSLLITAALVSAAGPTAASSIEDVTSGEAVNSSVATVSCADCPPLQPKKKHSYVVPELAPGTDRVEIKEIHGAVKSVRTEAWLGGSPVIFVNDASNEAIRAAAMKTGEQAVADRSATAFPPGYFGNLYRRHRKNRFGCDDLSGDAGYRVRSWRFTEN